MNPNLRVEKLFTEVKEENPDTFKKMEQYGKMLSDKYSNLITRLDGYFRTKCTSQIQWLEENATQTQQGPVLKDPSKRKDFENVVESLKECFSNNEIGAEPVLRKFEEETEKVYQKFNTEVQKCVKSNNDTEVKSCFKKLIGENLNDTQGLYENFTTQFDELNKKI